MSGIVFGLEKDGQRERWSSWSQRSVDLWQDNLKLDSRLSKWTIQSLTNQKWTIESSKTGPSYMWGSFFNHWPSTLIEMTIRSGPKPSSFRTVRFNLMRKCDKFILHFPLGNFATKKSNHNFKLVAIATEWNEFLDTYQQSGWWTIDQLVDHQRNQLPTWLKHNSRLGQFAFDQRFPLNTRSFWGQMCHFWYKWVISRSNEVKWILPVQAMIRQLRTPAQNPTIIA